MNKFKIIVSQLFTFAVVLALLQSCIYVDGNNRLNPIDSDTRTFTLRDFDQLEMGNAFDIRVRQSGDFSIKVDGDRRDIDDLEVFVDRNGKLVMRYRNWRVRRYNMNVDITMPTLRGVDFSGASRATVSGFGRIRSLDVKLSGASRANIDGDWETLRMGISGASNLVLRGQGSVLQGDLSGASRLDGFDFPVNEANIDLSGASTAYVLVDKLLRVEAAGASTVRYRGNPDVRPRTSGGSTIRKD
ncbi:MAG: DUF2807 domain-containing protein [Spirosomaceae bacterium]|jgi:hypothetical protein|nr:DUF2807 domain-containing protein [Spirosomataceae bacterium]